MQTLFFRLAGIVASFFIFSAAWFCLWSISLHLVDSPELAVLLFPFGLRMGLMLQCPRRYWLVLLGTEWLLLSWLSWQVPLPHLTFLLIGSLLSMLPVILISRYSDRRDWQTLLRQVAEKLAQGMAVKEIAAELGLSPKTVHVHRANLMEKLDVNNDVELARYMFAGW